MAWSTREIAELAGTSLRAVRHYHEIGLLEEPERRANGYKRYGVPHLERLLRIKRLTELGFSLPQIAAMDDADHDPEEALRALDADLAASIERLQRARAEVARLLRQPEPTELPPEFAEASKDVEIPEADRSFLVVLSRVLGPQSIQAYADTLRSVRWTPLDREFETLPADADEPTRIDLAQRMAPVVRGIQQEHPVLRQLPTDSPQETGFARQAVANALRELYNPAQLDVMRRLGELLNAPPPEHT